MRNSVDFNEGKGRDAGRVYRITEMSASQAEAWAFRVMLAILGQDVNVPDDFAALGMAGLARLGFQALGGLKWDVAAPLLHEIMTCVVAVPNPHKPNFTRPLIEEDIEEISTRVALRMAWWKLHMDFFLSAAPSLLESVKRPAGE